MNRPLNEELWSPGFITGRKIQDAMAFGALQLKDMLPMEMYNRRHVMDWFDDLRHKLLAACEQSQPAPRAPAGGSPSPNRASANAPEQIPDSRQQYNEYAQRHRGGRNDP